MSVQIKNEYIYAYCIHLYIYIYIYMYMYIYSAYIGAGSIYIGLTLGYLEPPGQRTWTLDADFKRDPTKKIPVPRPHHYPQIDNKYHHTKTKRP